MDLLRRVPQLFVGLFLYGVSMALMVESNLGLNPWDVFHQGLSEVTGISFGWIVLLVGVPVLLLWIPLRQRPGFGTVANLVVVGFSADAALAVLPAGEALPARIGYLVGGILLNGFATGLYIGSRMGPGPRDGLMTGLAARFPKISLRLIRTGLELSVLGAGFLLGGTAGIGTIAYAVTIGPLVHLFLPALTVRPRAGHAVAGAGPDVRPMPVP
ncbi:putative membrane protein [Actinoplanes missouriensis 431]|uniref:Putative membrane protein n=1 Tax=Actinoplanes missouriensis (strain ATCC 14538 / DSM 43046 / CBS 188.64 / JCM 3121 / NBRC 102363 / NCIMB 12654 / NRRL B-3342 / UNCC 431) TaxID=512565 RepID=I0H185_ACTM4|nr:membrane protein [Actinoplanes missouriensis]BAL86772.1 putative membrane protein [Actinoplanes missouriensis 431]